VWRAPFFLVVAVASAILFLCTGNAAPGWATNDLTSGNVQATIGTFNNVTAPGSSAQRADNLAAASFQWSLAEMDKVLGIKGWNYAPPSFAESVTGLWRLALEPGVTGHRRDEYNVTISKRMY
jgi:hypothetical protein